MILSVFLVIALGHTGKALVIINVDIGPCMMDSQLRMTLQWLSASEAEVAKLHFHGDAPKEFVIVSNKSAPYKLQFQSLSCVNHILYSNN